MEPGWHDPGGVHDEHVTGAHQVRKVADEAVRDRARTGGVTRISGAGGAGVGGATSGIEEAGGVARLDGVLRDRRCGEVVLGCLHGGRGYVGPGNRPGRRGYGAPGRRGAGRQGCRGAGARQRRGVRGAGVSGLGHAGVSEVT